MRLWGIAMTLFTTALANGGECKYTLDANGEKHGEVRCYNEKGVLTSLQHWKHGKFHGVWKSWTDEGRLYREESYRDQQQHGRYREWDSKTGFPKEEGDYANGQKVGEWRHYYDDAPGGRLYYVKVYSEKSEEISEKMFSPEGRMTQSTVRDLKAGVTVRETFHSNGKLETRTEDNEKTKKFTRWTFREDGKLARIERMTEYQSDGLQETIAENGHRELECYKMGQLQDSLGPCGGKTKIAADGSETIRRTWEDGKPREEFRLVNGERDGDWKSFDRQGRVTGTVVYKAGKAVSGKSMEYDDEGRLVAERHFADEKTTLERRYYQNGKVREEATAGAGGKWLLKTYYDDGKLEREVPFFPGNYGWGWSSRLPDGLEKAYDTDGKLAEETEYKNGRRHGTSKRYWDGKLVAKATYKEGDLVSETYYDEHGRMVSSTELHPDGSRK